MTTDTPTGPKSPQNRSEGRTGASRCVCGHPRRAHTILGCQRSWWTGCGCPAYEPDDDRDHGGSVGGYPGTLAYHGRYGGRYLP